MGIIDLVAIVIILGLGFLGFWRGFVRELVETIGAIAAALITYRFYNSISALIGIGADAKWTTKIAVAVGTFAVIMILISIAGHLIRKAIKAVHLGMYDHLLGFFLGGIKGAVIVAVLASVAMWISTPSAEAVSDTKVVRADLMLFDMFSGVMPHEVAARYKAVVNGLNQMGSGALNESALIVGLPKTILDKVPIKGVDLDNLREMLAANTNPSADRFEGTLLSWDDAAGRGRVRCTSCDNAAVYGIYAGSWRDPDARHSAQADTPLSFGLAYVRFLDEVCAVDLTADSGESQ